jgi:hypothetical protein
MMARRRREKDSRRRQNRESATLISEIGYIKSGIDDIKRKQAAYEERMYDFIARLSKLEAEQDKTAEFIK